MLLKKLFFIFVFIIIFSFSANSADISSLSAHSAVLINAQTKEIIYEKNAYAQRSMASTTKIMTAIIAIESGRLSQIVTAENMQSEGTSIGLENGNKLTLETLVWGMMLESGNDAAKLTANFLSGNEENFSLLMNEKADEIGMSDTNFVTASGLDDENHYTTAYDMALLGAYAVDNPIFKEICSSKIKTVRFIEPDVSKTFSNHNRLLSSCEGVFGIKTGFTKKSGRCLVTACERDGSVLVAVTLNAGDDWNDHIKLYDYGFEVSKSSDVFIRIPDTVKVCGGITDEVAVSLSSNPMRVSAKTDTELTQRVYLPKFIYAPVSKDDIIGKAQLLSNNRVVYECDIIAQTDIKAVEPLPDKVNIFAEFLNKIKEFFN